MIQWLVPVPSEHCLKARFCEPNCWEMSSKQGHTPQRYIMSYQHTGNILPWTSHDVFRTSKGSVVLLARKGLSPCPICDALIATAQTVGCWFSRCTQLLAADKQGTHSWLLGPENWSEMWIYSTTPSNLVNTWHTWHEERLVREGEMVNMLQHNHIQSTLACLNRTWTDQGHVITIVEKQPSIIISSPCIVFYLHTGSYLFIHKTVSPAACITSVKHC